MVAASWLLTCTLSMTSSYRHYLPLGAIEISALKPGTHIVRHCGPTNHRLRLHLGIKVPPLAAIKVGDVPARSWEEGKVMVMDDSFEHEVWNNNTKETRYAHTCAHVRTDACVVIYTVWGLTSTRARNGWHRTRRVGEAWCLETSRVLCLCKPYKSCYMLTFFLGR